jgi:hypothetical protein
MIAHCLILGWILSGPPLEVPKIALNVVYIKCEKSKRRIEQLSNNL